MLSKQYSCPQSTREWCFRSKTSYVWRAVALEGTPGTLFELKKEAESSPNERTFELPISFMVLQTQPYFHFSLSFFSSRAPTTAARQRKRKRKKGRSLVCFMSLTPQPVESCDRQCNFGWHGEVGDRQGNYSVQNLTNYRATLGKRQVTVPWCMVHLGARCLLLHGAPCCTALHVHRR